MGDILVKSGKVSDGKVTELKVDLHGLPERTIDRDTVLSWMKDGHSLVPLVDGQRATALQLVEVVEGDEVQHFIRTDNTATPSDDLGPLAG